MKFRAYDTKQSVDCETDIRSAEVSTIDTFVQTWVPSYTIQKLHDFSFRYALFQWDKVMRLSFVLSSKYRCYAAYTGSRLDGLICLTVNDEVKVEFLSTAPWNYRNNGRIRRIGSGLLFFTMKNSVYIGREGKFKLYALVDAEPFYESIGMAATGNRNQEGLKEYKMEKHEADLFVKGFEKYVIEI